MMMMMIIIIIVIIIIIITIQYSSNQFNLYLFMWKLNSPEAS
jgi:hypothetical protein